MGRLKTQSRRMLANYLDRLPRRFDLALRVVMTAVTLFAFASFVADNVSPHAFKGRPGVVREGAGSK